MDRVRDYTGFVLWLLGAGYIVLWPLTSFGKSGGPLAGGLICAHEPLRLLCRLPHPLTLPPGLQLLGVVSAAWVCWRLIMQAVKRLRRARTKRMAAAAMLGVRLPAALQRPPRCLPPGSVRPIKPRNHFGLRNPPA